MTFPRRFRCARASPQQSAGEELIELSPNRAYGAGGGISLFHLPENRASPTTMESRLDATRNR